MSDTATDETFAVDEHESTPSGNRVSPLSPPVPPQEPVATIVSADSTYRPSPPSVIASELAHLIDVMPHDGSYRCRLCSKLFGYKNGLIRHVRLTHMGERPYQCNICSRRFGYKHILMEHQNLHFGNRPYACGQCDKRFAARSNLIQHRLVHKRPFHCGLCGKRFDRDDQLKKHLFAHPQVVLTCNCCSYSASSQSDLNRHLLEAHHPQCVSTRETEQPPPQKREDGNGVSQNKRPGFDAICSQLGAESDGRPVIKKERLDDGFNDEISNGRPNASNQTSALLSSKRPLEFDILSTNDRPTKSSLPGIHEAFSHRRHLDNMPRVAGSYDFSNLLASSHEHFNTSLSMQTTRGATIAAVRRPTAHLPPITQVLPATARDQSTQHTAAIPGFPDLEEVIAYHVSQGTVFRCRHCNIVFFERGTYFLHVSLHGATSPWQCSICHAVCADKNEFTLHFVNQEHVSGGGTLTPTCNGASRP